MTLNPDKPQDSCSQV